MILIYIFIYGSTVILSGKRVLTILAVLASVNIQNFIEVQLYSEKHLSKNSMERLHGYSLAQEFPCQMCSVYK